jgi:hypothetical protein
MMRPMRIALGLLCGALVGALLGMLARALMRLVAIGMTVETEYHLGTSLAVVSLFALAGAGAGLARALDVGGWRAGLVLVVGAAPLFVVGLAFVLGETAEILDRDLTPLWQAELVAMAAVIDATVLVTPYAGWRAAGPTTRRYAR